MGTSGRGSLGDSYSCPCTIRRSCPFLFKSSEAGTVPCCAGAVQQLRCIQCLQIVWPHINVAGLVLFGAFLLRERGYNRPFEEKLYSQACTMCRPGSFSAILMSIPADGHRRRRCLCRSSPVLTGCWLTFPRPSLRCWTCMRHVLSICAVAPTQSIGAKLS